MLNTVYTEATGSLVFLESFPELTANGQYSELVSEFRFRIGSETSGRLFGWSFDRQDFEVLGTARWQKLTEMEWSVQRERWRNGWKRVFNRSAGNGCAFSPSQNADPERFFD